MFPILILAAGKSTRMGALKPFVRLNNGQTVLEYLVYNIKKAGISDIVVVLNDEGLEQLTKLNSELLFEIKVCINNTPEVGRFLSIKKGLSLLSDTAVFLQNIDNLYIDGELLKRMQALIKPESYVVPQFNGEGGHPILLSSSIVQSIINDSQDDVDLRLYLKDYQKIGCKCSTSQILLNINTQKELEQFQIENKSI